MAIESDVTARRQEQQRLAVQYDVASALAASGNPGNSSRAQLRAERTVPLGAGDRITLVGAL
jgi:hypothetical protein